MPSLREQVRSAVYSVISATMHKPEQGLDDSTQIVADLGAKSVNFVRIISALEDEFDLEIPFMEFRRKKTIGDAIEYIVGLCES